MKQLKIKWLDQSTSVLTCCNWRINDKDYLILDGTENHITQYISMYNIFWVAEMKSE